MCDLKLLASQRRFQSASQKSDLMGFMSVQRYNLLGVKIGFWLAGVNEATMKHNQYFV